MAVLNQSAYEKPWVMEVVKPSGEDTMDYLKRAYEAGKKVLA